MSTRGTMIQMTMSDGASVGVYQTKAQGARKGGLVLIQEIFGVTDHIKELADGYADQGYDVLAPALFDREAPGFQASYGPEDRQQAIKLARETHPFALSIADTQTCVDALKPQGKVFIVGYCYGGTVTWAAAARCTGLAAASAYYGGNIPSMADWQPRCPTILHFGRRDDHISMEAVAKVQAAHPALPIHLYDAGHGFNSDRRTDYDPECARLALSRTLELFASA